MISFGKHIHSHVTLAYVHVIAMPYIPKAFIFLNISKALKYFLPSTFRMGLRSGKLMTA